MLGGYLTCWLALGLTDVEANLDFLREERCPNTLRSPALEGVGNSVLLALIQSV